MAGGGRSTPGRPRGISGDGPGPGGPDRDVDPCSAINEIVTLASPQPDVLAGLKPDDRLSVGLVGNPPAIVAKTLHGEVAGTLVPPVAVHGKLVDCLKNGRAFVATVISVQGGKCVVDVSPGKA